MVIAQATRDLIQYSGDTGGILILAYHASQAGFPLSARLIFGFLVVTVPSLAVMVAISLYALWDLSTVNPKLR